MNAFQWYVAFCVLCMIAHIVNTILFLLGKYEN